MSKKIRDPQLNPDLGDETGDQSSPRPDENVAFEIANEVGVPFSEDEPVRTSADRLESRDDHRWELDPASSEDFPERQGDLEED